MRLLLVFGAMIVAAAWWLSREDKAAQRSAGEKVDEALKAAKDGTQAATEDLVEAARKSGRSVGLGESTVGERLDENLGELKAGAEKVVDAVKQELEPEGS